MTPCLFRPKAKTDLEEIADFTLKKWGKDQEEIYLRMLQRSFEVLSKNPNLGRPFDSIMPDLRRLFAGRHIILYFTTQTHIDIVRILHHSMDIERHIDLLEE